MKSAFSKSATNGGVQAFVRLPEKIAEFHRLLATFLIEINSH
jgi:hypothetical protein